VLADLDREFHLFELRLPLLLAIALLLLIQELAVVDDPANRRLALGSDLDEVEPLLLCNA